MACKIDGRTDHFDVERTQAYRFARQLAAKHVYDRVQMWQHCRAVGHIAKEQRVDVSNGQGTIVTFRDGSRMYKARSTPDTQWRVINYG